VSQLGRVDLGRVQADADAKLIFELDLADARLIFVVLVLEGQDALADARLRLFFGISGVLAKLLAELDREILFLGRLGGPARQDGGDGRTERAGQDTPQRAAPIRAGGECSR
jgi:hypothetical protein